MWEDDGTMWDDSEADFDINDVLVNIDFDILANIDGNLLIP